MCSELLRELYVEPPLVANEPPDHGLAAAASHVRTRDSAAAWERECTGTLNTVGFESVVSSPVLLRYGNTGRLHGGARG